MSGRFVRLARVEDIPVGEARVYQVEGSSIALCNVEGTIHAVENTCTHDDGPLGEGYLQGHVIECPRHGARFDVRSGNVLRMPAVVPIRTFPVKIEAGEVYIGIEED
jgi:3-phenylpropionate/trans-cinnamate dioxygenase ferredoxin subunit